MEQELAPASKKGLTAIGRAARRERIFARMNEGWAYDEIAREERLSARRVRGIIAESLNKREVDDGSAHAFLQLGRLKPALKAAGEAVAQGDVRAIAPLIKVLDRLDHYQKTAKMKRAEVKRGGGDALVIGELHRRMRRAILEEIAQEARAAQAARPPEADAPPAISPETAPQDPEKAQSAPGNSMGMDAPDGASALRVAAPAEGPLSPGASATISSEMAPPEAEKAQFANGMGAGSAFGNQDGVRRPIPVRASLNGAMAG